MTGKRKADSRIRFSKAGGHSLTASQILRSEGGRVQVKKTAKLAAKNAQAKKAGGAKASPTKASPGK